MALVSKVPKDGLFRVANHWTWQALIVAPNKPIFAMSSTRSTFEMPFAPLLQHHDFLLLHILQSGLFASLLYSMEWRLEDVPNSNGYFSSQERIDISYG